MKPRLSLRPFFVFPTLLCHFDRREKSHTSGATQWYWILSLRTLIHSRDASFLGMTRAMISLSFRPKEESHTSNATQWYWVLSLGTLTHSRDASFLGMTRTMISLSFRPKGEIPHKNSCIQLLLFPYINSVNFTIKKL